ncbi:hypothetical protein IAU59_002759 [Kwoniella sp. CBS 9459]
MSSGVSTSQAAAFHASFQAEKGEIQQVFENDPNPPLIELGRRISSLRAAVDGIACSIPLYDRGRYEKQLAELEAKLSTIRASERPKAKFSFARSKAPAAKPKQASLPAGTVSQAGPTLESTSTAVARASSVASSEEVSKLSSSSSSPSSTYTISNLRGQVVRPPVLPDDTTTYTLSLSSLEDCVIDLRPRLRHRTNTAEFSADTEVAQSVSSPKLTAIHGKGLRRCLLIAPVVGGSALLDEVEECVLILGAQQFRIHSSTRTTILLHVASLPVIEHSKDLVFGAYPSVLFADLAITSGDTAIGQASYESKHAQVQDFDWVRPGPSPNWRLARHDEAESATLDERMPYITAELLDRVTNMGDEEVESVLGLIIPKIASDKGH